jgi:hypothetical protein
MTRPHHQTNRQATALLLALPVLPLLLLRWHQHLQQAVLLVLLWLLVQPPAGRLPHTGPKRHCRLWQQWWQQLWQHGVHWCLPAPQTSQKESLPPCTGQQQQLGPGQRGPRQQ